MRILSIDWDYFIDASSSERSTMFPDGGNERLGLAMSNLIWEMRCATYPDIMKIKAKVREIDKLKSIIDNNKDTFRFASTDSHVHLGEFLLTDEMKKIIEDDQNELEIVSIDFHHDMYDDSDETELNCGNWVNKLCKSYPNVKFTWIHQEDSAKPDLIPSNLSYKESQDMNDADDLYHMIFLCRSSVWSCPHLDKEFSALNRFIARRSSGVLLREDMPSRYDDDMKKSIKLQSEMYRNMVCSNNL